VSALFLAMLAGTSKKPPDPRTPEQVVPQVTVPSTTGWPTHTVAGVKLQAPPGVGVDGNITVHMTVDVTFDRATGDRTDIAREREWYLTRSTGFVGFMLDMPDALVALREDHDVRFCEVTACSSRRLCTRAGLALDGTKRLTYDECSQVIAIARSMQ
jgi:hypothetical protein